MRFASRSSGRMNTMETCGAPRMVECAFCFPSRGAIRSQCERSSTADIDATPIKLDGGERGSDALSRVRSVGCRAPLVPPDGRNGDRGCERHNHPRLGEPPLSVCAEHGLTACADPTLGDDLAVLDDMGQPGDLIIPSANGTIRRVRKCVTHVSPGSKGNAVASQ